MADPNYPPMYAFATRAKLVERDSKTPSCNAQVFYKRARLEGVTPPLVHASLAELVTALESLAVLIRKAEARLDELVEMHDATQRFVEVPGVGPVTALLFFALVDAPSRFQSYGAVANYCGLVPKEGGSGELRKLGRLTKRGQPRMRTALSQAAAGILRTKNPQASPMQQWSLRLYNKKNWGVACSALSRKLCGVLSAMWRDGDGFEPARWAATIGKVYRLKTRKPAAAVPAAVNAPPSGTTPHPPLIRRRGLRQPSQPAI